MEAETALEGRESLRWEVEAKLMAGREVDAGAEVDAETGVEGGREAVLAGGSTDRLGEKRQRNAEDSTNPAGAPTG